MKKAKKLFSAMLFAFMLLLIMPVVIPGYSNTETVQAAAKQYTLVKGYVNNVLTATITNATNLVWTSSNPSVATVTATNGGTKITVTPKAKGTAIIKYRRASSSKYTEQYLINVATPNKTSLVRCKGGDYTLKLSGVPTGATVKWSVADDNKDATVAALSSATASSVKVTGKTKGTALVKVTINGKKQTCTYVKVEAPTLSSTSKTLTKGTSFTIKTSNTTQKTTWRIGKTSVATLSNATSTSVKVTGKAAGSTYIYADVGGATYKCKLTVKNPPTAADNMKTLKTTISKSTLRSADGYPMIQRTTTSKDKITKYVYSIVYETNKDRLKFVFTRKDSNSKRKATIVTYVYQPTKSYKTSPSLTITTENGVTFKAKTSFDCRAYSGSVNNTFSITSANVTLTSAKKTSMQKLANTYLNDLAFVRWEILLNKYNSSLNKIGFTAYK